MEKEGDASDEGRPSRDKCQRQDHLRHDTAVHTTKRRPFGMFIQIARAVL